MPSPLSKDCDTNAPFQRETDYRQDRFVRFAQTSLVGKRVVLYGAGANTRHIISRCPQLNIVAIADDRKQGEMLLNYEVMSLDRALAQNPDAIVVAAEYPSVVYVHQRISSACARANVPLFDMYGNDLALLDQKAREAINRSRSNKIALVEDCSTLGVDASLLFDSRADKTIRKQLDYCAYAVAQGKALFFVSEDEKLTEDVLSRRLAELGFSAPYKTLLFSAEELYKVNGLYRKLIQQQPEGRVAFMGSDTIFDIVLPLAYGIEAVPSFAYRDDGATNPLFTLSDSRWWDCIPHDVEEQHIALASCAKEHVSTTRSDAALEVLLGSLVVGFTSWLAQYFAEQNYDAVLFPSRDGYLLKQVYDLYRERFSDEMLPSSLYFRTSRKAALGATCGAESQKNRQNYYQYAADLGLRLDGAYAFIDFVGAGTLQKLLQELMPFTLTGYAFGSRIDDETLERVGVQHYFSERDLRFLTRYLILEPFLSSPEPSLAGFDDAGQPLFAPELRSKDDIQRMESIHRGALDFARGFFARWHPDDGIVHAAFLDAIMPALDDCDVSSMGLFDDLGGADIFNPFTHELMAKGTNHQPSTVDVPCAEPAGVECLSEKDNQRTLQGVLLDLLAALDLVCAEHGLEYIATHGTMLGAVRDGGFAPGDDDIDVAMPRPDYDKLVSLAEQGVFPAYYFLQTPENDPECFYGGFAKLRDSRTSALEPGMEERGYNQGMWIDIMPLDNCPVSAKKIARHRRFVRTWQRAINIKTYGPARLWGVDLRKVSVYAILAARYSRPKLCAKLRHTCMAYKPTGLLTVFAGNYDGRGDKVLYRVDDVAAAIRIPFEDTTIPVPRHAEEWLTRYYGDNWMQPPDEAEIKANTPKWGPRVDPNVPYVELLKEEEV